MLSIRSKQGFSLIELLLVIVIVGVLAAIAIPLFSEYKARGIDARSQTDLRHAAISEESYFADHETYVDCVNQSDCTNVLPGFFGSKGVDIRMTRVPEVGAVAEHFTGLAFHPSGSRKTALNAFVWNSDAGGLQ